jgi:hypothetical protein
LLYGNKSNHFLVFKKFTLLILPFIIIDITYLIFFLSVNSGYEGASINISSDIFIRFFYYSKTLFKFGISPGYKDFQEYFWVCLLIFVFSYLFVSKFNKHSLYIAVEIKDFSILIALTIYISSISLFVVNNWQSPKDVMHHHLYVASFAASIFLSKFIFIITKYIKFNFISKILFLSLFLILSLLSLSKTYKDIYKNKELIKNIRDELISSYDGSTYVVITGYNDYRPKFHPIM